MDQIVISIASTIGAASILGIAAWVGRRVSKAVKAYEHVSQALMETQMFLIDVNETLLEAAQGNINGNVETALKRTRDVKVRYQNFLIRGEVDGALTETR